MAKVRRKRKRYTQAQRANILSTAQKEGLTATDVKKRFGVTPVTYYSWRKKTGIAGRRGALIVRGIGGSDLTRQVRSEVQSKVREILPNIVRSEVSSYLNMVLSGGRGRRRQKV